MGKGCYSVGRGEEGSGMSGWASSRYRSGIAMRHDGRWHVLGLDGHKTLFARAVVEAHIGRELLPEEVVHHMNGDKADDRIENLHLFATQAEHARFHQEQDNRTWATTRWKSGRCLGCGCGHDERTPKCKNCNNRFYARRVQEKRRAAA